MTFQPAGVNAPVTETCELATRYRRDLSAGQAPWRCTRRCVVRGGERPVLYERSRDCAVGLLGTNEGGETTPGPADLVDASRGCHAWTHLWFQCVRGACLGGAGA